jgi:hypothetical protein
MKAQHIIIAGIICLAGCIAIKPTERIEFQRPTVIQRALPMTA